MECCSAAVQQDRFEKFGVEDGDMVGRVPFVLFCSLELIFLLPCIVYFLPTRSRSCKFKILCFFTTCRAASCRERSNCSYNGLQKILLFSFDGLVDR